MTTTLSETLTKTNTHTRQEDMTMLDNASGVPSRMISLVNEGGCEGSEIHPLLKA